MGELINGKTPEEVKSVLAICSSDPVLCKPCPNAGRPKCIDSAMIDALALIERLEAERDAAPALSLNTLRDEIYEDAVAHGLWEEAELDVNDECVRRGWEWEENLLRAACAQKIWDEAVELDEAWKSREHYSEELADVIIMSMSIAGKLGIDIDAEIRRKMEINRGRPWKHGKE